MPLLESLTFLLVAQLIGEVAVRGLAVPIPGPVVGLALVALIAGWRGVPSSLHETAHGLLRNLSLLFVPAGVGVMAQAGVIADSWLAIAVAIVVSAAASLAVTALVFNWAARRFGGGTEES